ncbi:uncharacterized protein LOC129738837 [Uranotaenia lowii]|uniref:uncharacterized protein LOC129738837 n=1 Tax=Uranotaenia lowii TaxID=190385 RepID=UPI00247A00B1|nr:uncharacterized protein LOC129738837 [Uranotaenia lowii]
MLMNIFIKHNLTNSALEDILSMLNIILGSDMLPKTFTKFSEFFSKNAFSRHYFCEVCIKYIGTEKTKCYKCDKEKLHFFITFDVVQNLKDVLLKNWESFEFFWRNNMNHTKTTDMVTAKVVQERKRTDNNSITLSLNTDGVKIFNSTAKKSLWPILLCINELPPTVRYAKTNVLVAGLWMSNKEPDFHMFLKPLSAALNEFQTNGANLNGREISTILITACCVDTIARCKLQNFKQFNGYEACGYCLHPGTILGRQIRYPYRRNVTLRNETDVLKAMAISDAKGQAVNGVKGISPLILFEKFDVVRNCPIDFMHCILLGICKQLSKQWFENPKCKAYIKARIPEIDNMLINIKHFHEASRRARRISDRHNWKANEWLQWLLHYSKICLPQCLPGAFYEHFQLLAVSVAELLQDEIIESTFLRCQQRLEMFVEQFEQLYGSREMTYNVHLLTHLVQSARDYGPLWAFSLFPFENINGVLKKFVKGPNEPLIQITNRCIMAHLQNTSFAQFSNPSVRDFCSKKVTNKSSRNELMVYDLQGLSNKYNSLQQFYVIDKLYNSKFFFKSVETRKTKTNRNGHNNCYFSIVENDAEVFGEIQNILSDGSQFYFVFKKIIIQSTNEALFKYQVQDEISLIRVNDTLSKYLTIDFNGSRYIVKLCYTLYVD